MIDIMSLSPAELDRFIFMQSMIARQEHNAAKVRALRDYYYGDHPVLLTMRQQEFLGPLLTEGNFQFSHNLVRSVLDTLRERLEVTGISVNGESVADVGETPDAAGNAALTMWDWWVQNRIDSQQIRLYRRALRDGKSYVIVDYDAENNRPRFNLHKIDDGTTGVIIHRDPTDTNNVLFATRYFYTFDLTRPGETGKQRKTVYLPHEIRKYIQARDGQWTQIMDDEDNGQWPLPWVGRDGKPLGVAVVEFENPGGSEIEQIIGLQNALNKSWLDLIAAADMSGFPLVSVEYPAGTMDLGSSTDDDIEGTDELRIAPGRILEIFNGGTMTRHDAANLAPMIDIVWATVAAIAGVSRTPQYYLRPMGGSDVPSGEALKQLESGLVRRAEERQLIFGQAWEDAFSLAWRVADTYGNRMPAVGDMTINFEWTDANVRNELHDAQIGQMHDALGVPRDAIWANLDYSPDEIRAFKTQQREDRAAEVATIAAGLRVAQTRAQPQNVTTNGNTNGNGVNGNG